MIEVQVGRIGKATLTGRTWASESDSLRNMLQLETDGLFIHGGIPDVEEFIVKEMMTRFVVPALPDANRNARDPWQNGDQTLISIVRTTKPKGGDSDESSDPVAY